MNKTERKLTLLARRLSKPSIFFHGTTTKFLPSIMKNGLDPTKIKEGNWREDKSTDYLNISKVSYGGIYFARSPYTAMGYANDLHRKQDEKYKPLLIAAQISEHSLIPDEDHYTGRIRGAIRKVTSGAEHIIAQYLSSILLKHEYSAPDFKKYNWQGRLHEFRHLALDAMGITPEQYEKRQDKKRLDGVIAGVFVAECKRHLAHLCAEKGYKDYYAGQYILNKAFHDIAPREVSNKYMESYKDGEYTYKRMLSPKSFKLPSPEKGEHDFKRAMDKLIHVTKNHVPGGKKEEHYTARKLDPIGFKGRNKIVCIIRHDTYNKKDYDAPDEYTLLYGHPPAKFFSDYVLRRTSNINIIWKDKTGKVIGHGDQVNYIDNNKHEWWHDLNKDNQEEYINSHPNTKLKVTNE